MRFGRLVAAVATSGLAVGIAVPATASSTSTYTLRIVAIDRFGNQVSTDPVVMHGAQNIIASGSQTVHVPGGRYIVGAAVMTPASGTAQLSYTLIAKMVTVSKSMTVTLDARTGKLLTVGFNAAGAHQTFQGGALCYGTGGGAMLAGVYSDPVGTTFVAPVPKVVQLFWQSRWESGKNTIYELAGAAPVGSTAAPHFHDGTSKLAKVRIQLRTGENVAGPGSGFLFGASPNCEPGGDILPVSAPWAGTGYLQAGHWSTDVGIGDRTLYWDGSFKAGHTYSLSLGAAVYGPWQSSAYYASFPNINGDHFAYYPSGLFSDPVAQASTSCKASITSVLSRGATVLRRSQSSGCSQNMLTRTLPRSGWYRLRVTGTQQTELSSKLALNWSFYAKIGPQQSWPVALPVALTEFRAYGLSLANAASPGARTRIVAHVLRAAYPDSPTPRNVLKTVRLEASFDGGATWHSLALTRSGMYWAADVHDPAAGKVSLRSIVINTAGDRSTETIYNAYAIR